MLEAISCPLPPLTLDPIICRLTSVPADSLEGEAERGVLWQAAKGRFLLEVPSVARYLAEHGRRIDIEPFPGAQSEEIVRFLRMTPLAAALYQRGILALHAAAVTRGNGAILLAGDSGAGKSALLAALVSQGWTLLSDDLSVLECDAAANLLVWPTFREMTLWQDTLDQLPPAMGDNRVHTGQGRYLVPAEHFASTPLPLRRIYWLSVYTGMELEVSEVTGTGRFQALSVLGYNSHIADALLERTAYFRLASVLARRTPIRRLRRPRGRWTLDELAALVTAEEAV
jgi:hypothetical protein